MHRLPRIFIHKKSVDSKRGRRGVSTVSPVNPKPKLERLNARKNFDYDSSSSSVSASIDDFTEELTGKNSFRIDGNQGEFLEFFQKLGFSGSDDFSIPADEWDAMMSRSSSEVDVSRSQLDPLVSSKLEFSNNRVIDVSSSRNFGGGGGSQCSGSGSGTSHKIEADIYICSDSPIVSDAIQLQIRSPELINDTSSDVVCKAVIRLEDGVTKKGAVLNGKGHVSLVGGGINGVRPPLLAPPPAMSLPIVDEACSTWDIFRAFYSDDHTESGPVGCEIYRSDVISGDEEGVNNEDDDEDNNRRRMDGLLSESCSFTASSNDDDSSSTTTEPMSIISPNGRFTRVITYWEKGGLLGRGSFGSVYEGISDYGFFFAVKEVSLLDQGKEGRQSLHQLEQEIELLSQFKHENIVQYYGTDTDDSKLYIFLELVTQGSLLSLYQKYNLQDSQVSSYTRQILHGLKYLHDQNVVHRDIKCANILVHVNGSVKLADFGLAKATKANDVKSCKGTALWMAPEVVNRKGQGYGLAADIWSLGCTVLEMLTRQFPYSHLECQMQALFRIGKGEPPPVPDTLSVEARDFIYMCLQVDPSARPTASQLLEHPFVKRTLASASGSGSPHNLGRRL